MRTNIVIDDKLMAAAMAAGNFKTKREAVEEGLRLIKRRKAYSDLLAARGTLQWDDSEAHWEQVRAAQPAVAEAALELHEASASYAAKGVKRAKAAVPDKAKSVRRSVPK
jgi:Arc/MetJ family transcription regulator